MDDSQPLAISAIQHFAYCPRQFALIHLEQAWADNRYTVEGLLLHSRVDEGEPEQRGNLRYERAVLITSQQLGLNGKMDLLEIETSYSPPKLTPVEYKRGKPKVQDWDRLQLCAQALCLEEMRNLDISAGALWYWQTRHREVVTFSDDLRQATLDAIRGAKEILLKGQTPAPTSHTKRCKACSLVDQCQPEVVRSDRSTFYVQELFKE
ncbi:CRISPR-associated protein Cas4 [Bacterioplanes sanyensis]|uniref:CRISPR-associated protein Cas4 n=1 Tax=Bacterioplanes sanyensis TaxID=1249553 RepID=UPI001676149B|nr:CRISPR-associated protein Cas4 [Bacterioplanes sanyensis]GGY43295.1 CRISPR-associated protein Cas4 [Bacterioplanes sanyensis]